MEHHVLWSATGMPHSTHTRTRWTGSLDFAPNSFLNRVTGNLHGIRALGRQSHRAPITFRYVRRWEEVLGWEGIQAAAEDGRGGRALIGRGMAAIAHARLERPLALRSREAYILKRCVCPALPRTRSAEASGERSELPFPGATRQAFPRTR